MDFTIHRNNDSFKDFDIDTVSGNEIDGPTRMNLGYLPAVNT
jgi:hypothetical protein